MNKFEGKIDFKSKYKKGSTFYFTFQTEPIQGSDLDIADSDEYNTIGKEN